MSLPSDYQRLNTFAAAASQKIGEPLFYCEHRRELTISEALLASGELAKRALALISTRALAAGHGVAHAHKVALEAGAITIVELGVKLPANVQPPAAWCSENSPADNDQVAGENMKNWQAQVALAHLAGLLHDICRGETQHAHKGAQAVENILKDFPITASEACRVARAIGAHEAFQEPMPTETGGTPPLNDLLADALYDADKFRWGPDNFTTTLWEMLLASGYPLEKVFERWERALAGVRRVRATFRSATGRRYGPDFIDRGIAIGAAIHDFWHNRH